MAEPWERQPGETSRAYAAFSVYRDLGPQRSLAKALAAAAKKPSNRRHWQRWAAKYRWVERAQAYDDYLDRLAREKAEQERAEMAKRHAQMALLFLQRVAERMRNLRPEELSPAELARWFRVAVEVERLARGESTSRTELMGRGGDVVRVVTKIVYPPGGDEDEAPEEADDG